MDAAELKQITEWIKEAGLSFIEIDRPGFSIRIPLRTGETLPPQAMSVRAATAKAVGVFLDRHPLRAAAFVQIGTAVGLGDIVGLVKNGRVLTPVVAPLSGTVTAILVAPGTIVDYGRPVMEIAAHSSSER